MKKILFSTITVMLILLSACSDYPVDDNDLLITDRKTCYMSSFDLVGADHQDVLVQRPTVGNGLIDTVAQTVTAVAKFGTNLIHVKPYCGVTDDITVNPGMGKWVDFTNSRKYTLISGDRQIRKDYTITVTVQQ